MLTETWVAVYRMSCVDKNILVLFAHWPNALGISVCVCMCVCVRVFDPVCIISFTDVCFFTGQIPWGLWADTWTGMCTRTRQSLHGSLPAGQSDDGGDRLQQRNPPTVNGDGQATRRHHSGWVSWLDRAQTDLWLFHGEGDAYPTWRLSPTSPGSVVSMLFPCSLTHGCPFWRPEGVEDWPRLHLWLWPTGGQHTVH